MQPEPSRYINSVSDLYGTDEIEFLLDDIRDLEPANCNPEDIQVDDAIIMSIVNNHIGDPDPDVDVLQDFEIAGSRTGALSGDCGGGCECECESPLSGTVHSWDSHANYRHRLTASPDASLFSGVIVYCDHTHFNSPTGVVRVLLVITTVACLTCLCTSGTVKVGLFMLPLVGRLRLMMFVTLLSLFVTSLLLFLDVSHIVYLFPFNWGKVNAWIYVTISLLFLISSSLILHMVFLSDAFSWVPRWTHQQLLVTGCLGYVCCLECLILTLIQKCNTAPYQPVTEDPSLTLQERQTTPPPLAAPLLSPESPELKTACQITHNYKAVVSNYQLAIPSTSRQNPPLTLSPPPPIAATAAAAMAPPISSTFPLDDVQPCSSKSVDPYRFA